jgi:hypothetical protein
MDYKPNGISLFRLDALRSDLWGMDGQNLKNLKTAHPT